MIDMTNATAGIDPFFEKIPDGQWNAFVGQQGDEQNYIDGYIEAAIELVSSVIDKRMILKRDTLAMPILYNGRHALELSLKFAINKLRTMGAIASPHKLNHDILLHWKHLHDNMVGDHTVRELVTELEPYVTSLANIDNDGQELRYAVNRSGQKSLANFAVVNLPLIRLSLEVMGKVLDRLRCRVLELEEERRTGSYTRHCSRSDLKDIAGMLGEHSGWKEDSFIKAKEAVKARYGIGNRKFSDAVNKIKASRQLAALVGLETDLTYLSDEKAIFVMEQWAKLHPTRKLHKNNLDSNLDWSTMEEYSRIEREVNQGVLGALTLEEISDLEVLFYIERRNKFGETYDDFLEEMVQNYRKASGMEEAVNHLMSKTNLLKCVAHGCKIVGRPSLAIKLMKLRPFASAA